MNRESINFIFAGDFDEVEVDRMHESVSSALKKLGIESGYIYTLLTVVDELSTNMLEHSSATWIDIGLMPDKDHIEMVLKDNGGKFDPTVLKDVDYESYLKTGTERKLGLYMVGQLTDSFRYERKDDINIVTFDVKLNSRGKS